jgi:uncharacterized protein (DUF2147 family)
MFRSSLPTVIRLAAVGVAALALFAPGTAGADAEDPIVGTWLTSAKDSAITIHLEGGTYVGHITWLEEAAGRPTTDEKNPDAALRARPLVGLAVLTGLRATGGGAYEGGKIYNPKEGKTYSAEAKLDGANVLKLRGFIGISLLGKTEIWTRR